VIGRGSQAPIDEAQLLQVEHHSIVAEFLSENRPIPMRRIGVRDEFGDAGTFDWLIETYEMDVDGIAAATRKVIARKR
jgi:transketolase